MEGSVTEGKYAAFDTSCICVHAPYYTETSRRITEWALFRSRRCFFSLFLPLLRISARGTMRCKNRLDAAESTGMYVTYLVLRASSLPAVTLFTFFRSSLAFFFALFRLGKVFDELSDQRDKTGNTCPENNITLLFQANWIQNFEAGFDIRKKKRYKCREVQSEREMLFFLDKCYR